MSPPLPATVAGLALACGSAVAVAVIFYRYLGVASKRISILQASAVGGLAFQVVHVLEHLLQLIFWVRSPADKPWLSSWAAGTADGLQFFCSLGPISSTAPSLGVEALHLTGNLVFLGALSAWQAATKSQGRVIRPLHLAERIQLFHVLEHLVLVGTLTATGKALGLSTAFGAVEEQSLIALRVWFHFGINGFATTFALIAARQTWGRPSAATTISGKASALTAT